MPQVVQLVQQMTGGTTTRSMLACWSLVWTILVMIPPGYTEQRCIVRMNMAHGFTATILAWATIINGWDSMYSTSASVAFFVVDAAFMIVNGQRLKARGERADSSGRWMDYAHHVIGAVYGTYLLFFQSSLCSPACPAPNLYTYAQTNEISTPFYGLYRLKKSSIAGGMFALTFFLSRIVFNFMYLVPYSFNYCCLIGFIIIAVPYQLLQVLWMALIIKKVTGTIGGQKVTISNDMKNGAGRAGTQAISEEAAQRKADLKVS